MFDEIRTGDPCRDADYFFQQQEEAYERWVDSRPRCVICDSPIIGDAVVLNDWCKTPICYACKVEQLEKATKALNPYIVEILQDALDELTKHEVEVA